jgi:hypothetical protein
MAGFIPTEGRHLIAELLFSDDATDRTTDMELGLFTNAANVDLTLTAAGTNPIAEPTGGGYARKALVDGTWSVTLGVASYAALTFTAASTAYSAPIRGYFICTVGATKRLIAVEVDNSGPYTMAANDTYTITPSVTIA